MREIPTALAPTAELAEPKIRKFAENLANSVNGTVHDFYACEPCVKQVWASYDRKSPTWLVGDWGLFLRCETFSLNDLESSKTIDVEFVEANAHSDHSMIVTLQLSARVMR